MMENFLSAAIMETALVDILLPIKKWSEINREDFFAILQEAIEIHNATHLLPTEELTVKNIMEDWIGNDVDPLIRLDILDNETISLTQQTMLRRKESHNGLKVFQISNSSSGLWIPLKLVTENGTSETIWFPKKNVTFNATHFNVKVNTTQPWIIFDTDQSFFFWTTYGSTMRKKLVNQLIRNCSVFSGGTRRDFIAESFRLEKEGIVSIEDALDMTRYFGAEKELYIWDLIEETKFRMNEDPDAFESYKKYFVPRFEPAFGQESENNTRIVDNRRLLMWCSELEIPTCLKLANDDFERYRANSSIKYPFRGSLNYEGFCYVIGASNNQSNWDFVMTKYKEVEEKEDGDTYDFLKGLMCTKNASLLNELLGMTLNKSSSAHKWSMEMFMYLLPSNPTRVTQLFNFMKKNLVNGKVSPQWFKDFLKFVIGRMGKYPEGLIDDLDTFVNENQKVLEPVLNEVKDTIAEIKKCDRCIWWETTGNRLAAWFKKTTQEEIEYESILSDINST